MIGSTQQPLDPGELQRAVHTKRLGKKIHYFRTTASTNSEAFELARRGAEEGEIVIAESQTQGRGRLGRHWFSPFDRNLCLSVILRPTLPPADVPQITLLCAVALAETVQSFLDYSPQIKWPNDILVGGKKLAGVLTESSCERDRVLFVILGIGVNINIPIEMMPEKIRDTATSLMMCTGGSVDRLAFANGLIHSLDRCYEDLENNGFAPMARRWDRFFHLRGRRVRVEMADRSVSGKAIGIDSDGALLVEGDEGARERILAGDVIPVES
ncbi:MAG: biotin--[acetyl-CoA-carboxylase] ligase [Candidatus Binatia bacterium]|jgi:BirA family biotin operon repressor/biotin-[acetyl-CoA-carboxylase] ligase|nr:biotin--[acetyl-CoA-carboxylase] ligase [Candidatus Binatia bacterium]